MAQTSNLNYSKTTHTVEWAADRNNNNPLELCVVSMFPEYGGMYLYGPNQTISPENTTQDYTYRTVTGLNLNTVFGSNINNFLWAGIKFYSDNSPFHSGDVVGDSLPRPYGQNGNGPRFSALSKDIVFTALHFVNYSGFKDTINNGTLYFWHNGQIIQRTIKQIITFVSTAFNNNNSGLTVISKDVSNNFVYTNYTNQLVASYPNEYGITSQNFSQKVSPFSDCVMLVLNEKLPDDFITPYLFENTTAHDFADHVYDIMGGPNGYESSPITEELLCQKLYIDQNNFIRNTYAPMLLNYFQTILNTPTIDYTADQFIKLFNTHAFTFDNNEEDELVKFEKCLSLIVDSAVNHDSSSPVCYYAPVLSKPILVNFLTFGGDVIGGYGEKLGTNQGLPLFGSSTSEIVLPNTTLIFYQFLNDYLGCSIPSILNETDTEYLNFKLYTEELNNKFNKFVQKSSPTDKNKASVYTNITLNDTFDNFSISDIVLSPSTFYKHKDYNIDSSYLFNKLNNFACYYSGYPFGIYSTTFFESGGSVTYTDSLKSDTALTYFKQIENLNKPNTTKNIILNKTNYINFQINVMPLLIKYFESQYGYSNIYYTTASSYYTFSLTNKSFYNFLNNKHISDKGAYYFKVTAFINDTDDYLPQDNILFTIRPYAYVQFLALLKYLPTLTDQERNNKIFDIFTQSIQDTNNYNQGNGILFYKKIDQSVTYGLNPYHLILYTGNISSLKLKIDLLKQNNTIDYTWYFNIINPSTEQSYSNIHISSGEESSTVKNKYYSYAPAQTYSDVVFIEIPCNEDEITPLLGDYNKDGIVNGADLSQLLSAWNTINYSIDLDGDGFVGGSDLAILLSKFNQTIQNRPECNTNSYTEYEKSISFSDLNYNNPTEINKILLYPNQTANSINNIIKN